MKLLPLVPAAATSVAAPDSGSCSPGLDGLMVGEVGQGWPEQLWLYIRAHGLRWVVSQFRNLFLRKLKVENMHSASTEPGTITKASSASTAHSERFAAQT